MKLKHPAVLSVTPICHCNSNSEKTQTERWKERQRERDGLEGEGEIFADPSGQGRCADMEEHRWGDERGIKGSAEIDTEREQSETKRIKAFKPKGKASVIETEDKKSFVSKSRLSDGQDKTERQDVKETEIARKPPQQTFTGVFCGTYLPLWYHSRWVSHSIQGSACCEQSWFSIY